MGAYSLFEKANDEYIKFDKVSNKLSNRPDLHAFLLLDRLFPGETDMVCCAEHDKIWLDVSSENIEKLSEDEIVELVRCGVMYEDESLSMFA